MREHTFKDAIAEVRAVRENNEKESLRVEQNQDVLDWVRADSSRFYYLCRRHIGSGLTIKEIVLQAIREKEQD